MSEVTFTRRAVLHYARGVKRAEDMNETEVAALNKCGRYLSVEVYRWHSQGRVVDCTAGGVTANDALTLFVPHPRGNYTLEELSEREDTCILEMLPPAMPNCPVRFKPRGEDRWCMAGGNHVGSCDSRFSELYRYPCSVHDRIESRTSADAPADTVKGPQHKRARLVAELADVLEAFLCDQEPLNEPFRNEAICERARAVLAKAGRGEETEEAPTPAGE